MKKAADATPNQLLAEERLKRHWLQQEVADRVGTTVINVSRWERGMSVPGAYFRYQLCALFDKSAAELGLVAKSNVDMVSNAPLLSQETAQQALVSIVSLSLPQPQQYWNVPYRRNPFFTGREDLLSRLAALLAPGKSVAAQPCAISGLGGIGKTQVALEYAYRYRDTYATVLWARADTHENVLTDVVDIADILGLRALDEQEPPHTVASAPSASSAETAKAVKRWLSEHAGWLLILDNAEDLMVINAVLPTAHQGCVLLTTRTQITGTLAQQLDLEKMGPEEGSLFLLRRAKRIAPSATLAEVPAALWASARQIALLMDGLPLALDQAGAYIEETGCDIADYLDRFQARRASLLNVRGEVVTDHPASVAVTFSLALEKVEQAYPLAADLLRLCAFLHPDAIPEELLGEGVAALSAVPSSAGSDLFPFNTAIKELRKFSLVQRNPETKMFTVHRLVQAVTRDGMDEETQHHWAEYTVRVVSRVFPDGKFATWPRCQRCLPQVSTCATLIEQAQLVFPEAAALLQQAGRYVYEQASFYALAAPFFQQALAIYEQVLGPEHPDVAQCLVYLGRIANEQGQYSAAESLFQHALAIQEAALEPTHPAVVQSLTYLVQFYMEQGQYAQAELLSERVVCIGQQSSVTDDLQAAKNLNTLACIYFYQDKYEQAASSFQQVLAMREQVLQADHPEVASSLTNLGDTFVAQEHYTQAELLYQRALAMYEHTLQPGHPMIGLTLNTLARIYYWQERYELAEPLCQRALRIRTEALGVDSPCVAESLSNLADLYLMQHLLTQVEPYCNRALAIYQRVWGTTYAEHLEVAHIYTTFAKLFHEQRQYIQAASYFQQAHTIRQQVLGADHSHVVRCLQEWQTLVGSTV